MIELPEPICFQWDQGNADKNFKAHKVTKEEAEEVFRCQFFLAHQDTKHSTGQETRFQAFGETRIGRKIFVAFTIRDQWIRPISVRDMKEKERTAYEQAKKRT